MGERRGFTEGSQQGDVVREGLTEGFNILEINVRFFNLGSEYIDIHSLKLFFNLSMCFIYPFVCAVLEKENIHCLQVNIQL